MKWNCRQRLTNHNHNPLPPQRARIIGQFGEGTLVEHANGRHELVGGRPGDLTAAQEWASMFAHELVFSQVERSRLGLIPGRS
jgi:hypothetical protein